VTGERKRRIHERRPVELSATIVAEGVRHDAITRDLGMGGAKLSCAALLVFGQAVQVLLYLPALDVPTEIDGVVRWQGDGHIGIQFLDLRARDVWALNRLLLG
jgi:hypothetical protein